MTAFALALPAPEPWRVARAGTAGLVWGFAVAGGLTLAQWFSCEGVCLAALPGTFALAIGAGLATMGPLVYLLAREERAGRAR